MCCNDGDDETWQAANAICCMSAYRVKTCPRPWELWRLKNILRDNLENNNVFAEILQIVPGDSKTYFPGSSGGWKTCSRLDTHTSMGACPVQTILGTLPPEALKTQKHSQNVSGSSKINSKCPWELWTLKNILKTFQEVRISIQNVPGSFGDSKTCSKPVKEFKYQFKTFLGDLEIQKHTQNGNLDIQGLLFPPPSSLPPYLSAFPWPLILGFLFHTLGYMCYSHLNFALIGKQHL